MKKVMTGIAAATLALGVLTTNAHGDENDVSPLLAKKAAVYAIMKGTEAKLTLLGQGYTEFFISDAIEIYSYKGDTKWYLFYYAYGTDRLPTWKEMEDAERKYGPTGEVNGGYVRWLYIRATTKMRPGPPEIGAGMPPGIRFRFMAEGTLRTALPGAKEVKFIKAFACRSEVTFFMYEFDVDGERYAVAPWLLHYKKVAELRPEPPLKMSDEYRAKWEEIDSAIPDAAVERSRVVIDEMKEFVPLLGKSVNSYNDISESVPNYYQNGQGAPGNNWGCGTVSAASVAGSYKGKGYDWYGDTDDEWDSYNYGWWILGNKQPVPTQYSLFWYLQQHGNPQLMSFSQLKAGFNDWLKWHMDGETYNKFDLKYYWPWDYTSGYLGLT